MTEKCGLCGKTRKPGPGMFRCIIGSHIEIHILPKCIICNICMNKIDSHIRDAMKKGVK